MRFLRRLLDRQTGTRIEHPVLGEAVYFKAKFGSYWEVDTEVGAWPFTLILDSENLEEPSPSQVAFFQRFASDPDVAFRIVSSLLIPTYEKWAKEPFPKVWQDKLSFVGMSIPRPANESLTYELSFEGPRGERAGHFAFKVTNGGVASVEVSS
jgi:hypothetical protein